MERTVVGIDVGSSKVCVLVGEVGGEYDLRIVGVGIVPARGMRKGVVVNLDATDAFHLYRMVRLPHSYEVRLYRDNDPTPVAVGLGGPGFAVEPTSTLLFPQVLLGDNSNDPLYNASYVLDFVRYLTGRRTRPCCQPPIPRPPSTGMVAPVMYDAPGPTRKATASATSAGVPRRGMATVFINASR